MALPTTCRCWRRELLEELDIEVRVGDALTRIDHTYPTVRVTLHPYLCDWTAREPQAISCDEFRWIVPADLPGYAFPPASSTMLTEVMARLAKSPADTDGPASPPR